MSWKAVWRSATGELISVGTVVADPLPEDVSVTELGEERPTGQWNAQSKVFEPIPAEPRTQLTKLQFRELFPAATREYVDEFNALFEGHPGLSAAQKRAIRTGLKDFDNASHIALPLDARVLAMLSLYQAAGILSAEQAAAIVEQANG